MKVLMHGGDAMITISDAPCDRTIEVAPNLMVDFDESGAVVGVLIAGVGSRIDVTSEGDGTMFWHYPP